MYISNKTWRRRVFWPRLSSAVFVLLCVWALVWGYAPRPF